MIVVVDASVIVDYVTGVVHLDPFVLRSDLHAPVTVDAEVLHGLRRQCNAKLLADEQALVAIRVFEAMPITRHPVQPFVRRMWELRRNVATYDAAYVALAESLDVPLLTRDGRLSRSSGHAARIEYID